MGRIVLGDAAMEGRDLDMAIVGGGLAGGLIALAVRRARPDLRIALFEAGDVLGGNHRWSWFASDLDAASTALMGRFRLTRWDDGYEVRFPAYARRLGTTYLSLASTDFAAMLAEELPSEAIRTGACVAEVASDSITLEGGEAISARAVIDCRNFAPSSHLHGGWQVFVGHHLRLSEPHGIERPIVMDATVAQPDAYRFVYVLPLAPDEIFVEDTYYADRPTLDRALLDRRIEEYCTTQGWTAEIVGREAGVLPVITGGDFPAYRVSLGPPGVVQAGGRGGFVQPLTSYTLPFTVANALVIAENAGRSGFELAALIEARAETHWRRTRFYRALGRMLFEAAEPAQRYRIFERFYRLPRPLIERFYAGRSSAFDKARILYGKPPVSVVAAFGALLGKGRPLVHDDGR